MLNKDNRREVTRSKSGIPQVILGQGHATLGAWGNQKVIHDKSLLMTLFTHDLPIRKVSIFENDIELLDNSVSVKATSTNGLLSLKSGAVLADNTIVRSKASPRIQPDRGHKYAVSFMLDTAYTVGSTIRFGLGAKENKVYYEVKDSILYAVIESNSIITKREEITLPEDWNVDLTKNQIADIIFQYRGVGNYKFYWGNPNTGLLELVHKIEFLNQASALSMENPALPIYFECINDGAEAIARFGCTDIASEGGTDPVYSYTRAISEKTAVVDGILLAVRVPRTYLGKELLRDFILKRISGDSDKKGRVRVYHTRDETCLKITGVDLVDADWNLSSPGSALEDNITANEYDVAKATQLRPFTVQANIDSFVDSTEGVLFQLYPGDIIFIVGSFATADVNVVVELGEEV